jgi:hypothetical protein
VSPVVPFYAPAPAPQRRTLTQLGGALAVLFLSFACGMVGYACGTARWDRDRAHLNRQLAECEDLTTQLRQDRNDCADGWDTCTARLLECGR